MKKLLFPGAGTLIPTFAAVYNDASRINGPNATAINGRYVYVTAPDNDVLAPLDMGCDPRGNSSIQSCTVEGRVDYFRQQRRSGIVTELTSA